MVGLPMNHPVRVASLDRIPRGDDPEATAFGDCRLRATVEVGSPASDEGDLYGWMERLAGEVRRAFDYGEALRRLPDPHVLRIEWMVREIRDRLRSERS
jgi:hypothetical protein